MTASARRLDCDAIASLETPTPGGLSADFFDDADRFMAGDHWEAQQSVELPVILIHITATDAAGFDPHQRVVGPDPWHVKLLQLEAFVADLDDCSRFSHAHSPATHRLSRLDGFPFPRTL